MKEEMHITNDTYKGVIMLKNDNNYLIDVYVSNGDGSIITSLLSKKFKDYSRAVISYGNTIKYIKNSNVIDILKKMNSILKFKIEFLEL